MGRLVTTPAPARQNLGALQERLAALAPQGIYGPPLALATQEYHPPTVEQVQQSVARALLDYHIDIQACPVLHALGRDSFVLRVARYLLEAAHIGQPRGELDLLSDGYRWRSFVVWTVMLPKHGVVPQRVLAIPSEEGVLWLLLERLLVQSPQLQPLQALLRRHPLLAFTPGLDELLIRALAASRTPTPALRWTVLTSWIPSWRLVHPMPWRKASQLIRHTLVRRMLPEGAVAALPLQIGALEPTVVAQKAKASKVLRQILTASEQEFESAMAALCMLCCPEVAQGMDLDSVIKVMRDLEPCDLVATSTDDNNDLNATNSDAVASVLSFANAVKEELCCKKS